MLMIGKMAAMRNDFGFEPFKSTKYFGYFRFEGFTNILPSNDI